MQSEIAPGAAVPEIPFELIMQVQRWVMWGSITLALLVLAARAARAWLAKPAAIRLTTKDVGSFVGQSGQTLLDALRAQGQPHASLCAGRGRCGTCAVRVLKADTTLPAPTPLEQATLDRLAKGADVRLACQLPLTCGGALTGERVFAPDFSFDAEAPEPSPKSSVPA